MRITIAPTSKSIRVAGLLAILACLLVSCSPPQEPDEFAPLSESQAETVESQGLRFQAMTYDDPAARSVFGFDIRGAGLQPVRLTLQNLSAGTVKVMPRQTFLIGQDGLAWPLLTSEQAAARLDHLVKTAPAVPEKRVPEDSDSFTAFALDLVAGPGFPVDSKPSRNRQNAVGRRFVEKSLRNPGVLAGQAASALLLFPAPQESHGFRALRICYEQAGRLAFLSLPLLKAPAPKAAGQ